MILESVFVEWQSIHASDIHLKENQVVIFRKEWELLASTQDIKVTRELLIEVLAHFLWNKETRMKKFDSDKEIDFGYLHTDGVGYRGNAYMFMGRIGIALRRIEDKARPIDELGLPSSIGHILAARQWLFLITGPTGSGKSTTMVSILDTINIRRKEHIITIEDPVEFVFKNKKSIFSQREVGRDTGWFSQAIRAAMREDPDIVVIGEMRDAETVEAALALAETGHLVFSTLHTSGSVQTLNRIIQFFPSESENQIRTRLGDSLIWVLSQRLIPRIDKPERLAIREMMYVTPAIRNLIKTWDFKQIKNTIELGTQDGMISMKKHAEGFVKMGYIETKDYIGYLINEND